MSAVVSAGRVIVWALDPEGEAPDGPVVDADRLGDAAVTGPRLAPLVAALARSGAARLGAGSPPLGDRSAIGPGPLLLAAALAGRAHEALSTGLAGVAARSPSWAEAVARHALVDPALRGPTRIGLPLNTALLEASPLSALATGPPGRRGAALSYADRLRRRPRGAAVLVGLLATPTDHPDTCRWRAHVMHQLLQTDAGTDLVLRIYTQARVAYGDQWDALVAPAVRQLARPVTPPPESVAAIGYWAPLHAIRRKHGHGRLRAQPSLTGHVPAIDAVRDRRLETYGEGG